MTFLAEQLSKESFQTVALFYKTKIFQQAYMCLLFLEKPSGGHEENYLSALIFLINKHLKPLICGAFLFNVVQID